MHDLKYLTSKSTVFYASQSLRVFVPFVSKVSQERWPISSMAFTHPRTVTSVPPCSDNCVNARGFVCTRVPHRLPGTSSWRSVKPTDSKGSRNQMSGCPLPKRKCWIWHRQREKERAQLVESRTAVAKAELTANCATGPWHRSARCNLFAKPPDRLG